jgi:hypothetical protein
MTGRLSRRGQPLIAFVMLLGCWVSARAMMWEPKAAPHLPLLATSLDLFGNGASEDARPSAEAGDDLAVDEWAGPAPMSVPAAGGIALAEEGAAQADVREPMPADPLPPAPRAAIAALPSNSFAGIPAEPVLDLPPGPMPVATPVMPKTAPVPVRATIGHTLLWMAAMARVPIPASMTSFGDLARLVPGGGELARTGTSRQRRWSVDSWILWRQGSNAALSGGLLTPSYGASQAGAVVRYRLASASDLRPAAYLRTTGALGRSNEREVALGLQLRPVRGLPVVLAGEGRMTSASGRTFLRPAVLAFTELNPFDLPLGFRGEAYGQAGYVGGGFATAFADGQLRVDQRLAGLGKGDLRLGAGVWGGIQKGSSRLDAGPSLTFGRPLGGSSSVRVAADWRFRVAGRASPGSGPAVTLSAGF